MVRKHAGASVQKPNGSVIQLYRRIQWGALAKLDMLDTRQFRDK